MPENITFRKISPSSSLSEFVESFWFVHNPTPQEKNFTVLPDGYFDLIVRYTNRHPYKISLAGLWTKPSECIIPGNTSFLAISFKLLSLEYIFKTSISSLTDKEMLLPDNFWDLELTDMDDFENFVGKTSRKMENIVASGKEIDNRKLKLFNALYQHNGSVSVTQIAEQILWSSRQINRYFNDRIGFPLKVYANILRYRASFNQISKKQLYPVQNYFDQPHFIRNVKKYSGVTPKDLSKNKNDRFIQFSTLPQT